MLNSITPNFNLRASGGPITCEPNPRSKMSQLETQLNVVEAEVISGIFNSLIDTLNIFSFKIEHFSLIEEPNIAFRYLELANKIPNKSLDLENLLRKVHQSFIANKVYENGNPKKNVLITCPKGSVMSNKIILKMSYPYFEEIFKSLHNMDDSGKKNKIEIKFDEIESLDALDQFCKLTYAPWKIKDMKNNLEQDTLFQLHLLAKKISYNELANECIQSLNLVSGINKPEDLKTLLDLDDKYSSIRWNGLTAYLKKNNISFMKSNNEEIALNVKSIEILKGESNLSKLMHLYTTGLYVESIGDLEKLLMCCISLKEKIREKITTLIFPGFQSSDEYTLLAKYLPNMSNIIVRNIIGQDPNPPNCFPSLMTFSWIRGEEKDCRFFPKYIAEINFNKDFWVRATSIQQLKDDISLNNFNRSFSWKIEKDGCISDLFCKTLQKTPIMVMY